MTFDAERVIVLNAFSPSVEISDPARFAGRADLVRRLTDVLHTDGLSAIVFGDRGIGKSSLAAQIERIALGDTELLSSLGSESRAFTNEKQFVVLTVRCTDAVRTKDELLQQLINVGEATLELDNADVSPTKTVVRRVKLKVFENEVSTKYEPQHAARWSNLNVEERLHLVTAYVTEQTGRRVLVIVDELDRVKDTTGLASFMKSYSSSSLTLFLVGIGASVSHLVGDHQSVSRLLHSAHVRRMERTELVNIIERTEALLQESGVNITFSASARQAVASVAQGFPWFVHVIGRAALLNAYDARRGVVSDTDVQAAMEQLAINAFVQQFNDLYETAVGDSMSREIVLRLFAQWNDTNVPTSEIYAVAHKLGVKNPSQAAKELQTEARGAVIRRAPNRDRGLFFFSNSMFKVFVNLRPSIYEGVREQCDKGWSDRDGKPAG